MSRFFRHREIDPDEVFLDASNLPQLDPSQFEGRVEYPISRAAVMSVGAAFGLGVLIFLGQAFNLQVVRGEAYAEISRENRLARTVLFASRGVIYDRVGRPLAWNEAPSSAVADEGAESRSRPGFDVAKTGAGEAATSTVPYAKRAYAKIPGLAHLIGFVSYPKRDSAGVWWREDYTGVSGVELTYDAVLRGTNGSRMVETNARGEVERSHIVSPPERGGDVRLTVDAEVQSQLFTLLSAHAKAQGFLGGAAAIMDVKTGELIALTSFPEYDNAAFAEGDVAAVKAANADSRIPLLFRAVAGQYTPGSIIKPILAAAALEEGIIAPEKKILSTGELIVPNPYDRSKPSIFRDWKAHGWVDMRAALAVSSDQYFYIVGGGYEGQRGLGIASIDEYARAFGLGAETGIELLGEQAGTIPTPEWKEATFGAKDPWRIGDTYITSIGQFGFQITVLQAVSYAAAIANGGVLPGPTLSLNASRRSPFAFGESRSRSVGVSDQYLQVVREGMRLAVSSELPDRTARALDLWGIDIAAKTGTAEVGERKQFMNSWVIGFWPSSAPRYAFAVVLEKAPAGTLSGAAPAMSNFFYWLIQNKPEYVR